MHIKDEQYYSECSEEAGHHHISIQFVYLDAKPQRYVMPKWGEAINYNILSVMCYYDCSKSVRSLPVILT